MRVEYKILIATTIFMTLLVFFSLILCAICQTLHIPTIIQFLLAGLIGWYWGKVIARYFHKKGWL